MEWKVNILKAFCAMKNIHIFFCKYSRGRSTYAHTHNTSVWMPWGGGLHLEGERTLQYKECLSVDSIVSRLEYCWSNILWRANIYISKIQIPIALLEVIILIIGKSHKKKKKTYDLFKPLYLYLSAFVTD